MAKGRVATAYVEIRPDLDNFAKELRAKLQAQKHSIKIPVQADTKSMADSIKRSVKDPAVRSAAQEAADELARQRKEEARKQRDAEREALYEKRRLQREEDRIMRGLEQEAAAERRRIAQEEARQLRQLEADERYERRRLQRQEDTDRRNEIREARNEELRIQRQAAAEAARELRDQQRERNRIRQTELRQQREAIAEEKRVAREAETERKRVQREMLRDAYRQNAEFDRIRRNRLRGEKNYITDVSKAYEAAVKEQRKRDDEERDRNRGRISRWIHNELGDLRNSLGRVSNGWSEFLTNKFVLPFAVAFIAMAATVIASWINVMAVGVLGLIPIVVGILANKGVPAFAKAAEGFTTRLKEIFHTAALPMVTPLREAIEYLTEHMGPLQKIGQQIMGGLNVQIYQLSRGALQFVTYLSEGFRDALPGIRAVLTGLAISLPRLGKTIGDAFRKLAEDPEQLLDMAEGFVTALQNIVKWTAIVIRQFASWGQMTRHAWRNFNDGWEAFRGSFAVWNPQDIGPRWKKYWNDLTGATDKAAEEHRRHMLQISEDTANLVHRVEGLDIAGVTSKMIEDVIAEGVKNFGEGALTTEAFAQMIIRNLQRIGKQVTETNWGTFAKDAATGFRSVDKATTDARKAIDDLIDSVDVLNGRFIASEDAFDAFYEIQNDIADEMNSEDGLTVAFDDLSRAGIKHQKTIRDQSAALVDVVKAQLKQGQSLSQIMPKYAEMRQQISDNATAFSGSRTAAENYLAALRLTPEEIITQLALAGMPEAITELEKLTGEHKVPITADPDENNFALVGEYIVAAMTNAGAMAGVSFADFMRNKTESRFYDTTTNWRLVGQIAGQATADGYTDAEHMGAMTKRWADEMQKGMASEAPTQQKAGEDASKEVAKGSKSYGALAGMGEAATSLVNSLAAGLKSFTSQSTLQGAGSFIAGIVRGALQGNSPPDYGPLSGKGYMTYVGQTLASDLAKGLISGESKVEKASARVAAAIAFGGNYGLSTSVGPALLGVNVYVGNEKLDSRIDYRVERNDQANALGLYAGRTEV